MVQYSEWVRKNGELPEGTVPGVVVRVAAVITFIVVLTLGFSVIGDSVVVTEPHVRHDLAQRTCINSEFFLQCPASAHESQAEFEECRLTQLVGSVCVVVVVGVTMFSPVKQCSTHVSHIQCIIVNTCMHRVRVYNVTIPGHTHYYKRLELNILVDEYAHWNGISIVTSLLTLIACFGTVFQHISRVFSTLVIICPCVTLFVITIAVYAFNVAAKQNILKRRWTTTSFRVMVALILWNH